MCGINGIYLYGGHGSIDKSELIRTRDFMRSRGPDGCGLWVSECKLVGFGHRRLSIIDLSDDARQPMTNADGSLVITFNGEIYNYKEIRNILEAKGYSFLTNSDTEVILHLYRDRGPQLVHDIRGMFAIAIWDSSQQELFLARDPLGIKPLYYSDDGHSIRFASQVKALMASGVISEEVDSAGLVGFYLWGSVPEPFTIRRAISALPAGCTMRIKGRRVFGPEQYYSVGRIFQDGERLSGSARVHTARSFDLQEGLLDSVKHHLVADVPIGLFLSSGVDSLALLGLMKDAGQREVRTITLAFNEYSNTPADEAPIASHIADFYKTHHTTRTVTREEFNADLTKIFDAMDQPTIDGINTWFVSKAAQEAGLKSAISGVGGDELFAGYPSFQDLPSWVVSLSHVSKVPGLGKISRKLLRPLTERLGLNPKLAGLIELAGDYSSAYLLRRGLFMPWELEKLLDPKLVKEGLARLAPIDLVRESIRPEPDAPASKISALEISNYMRNQLLRDTDWASMAHSVEVRLPLADAQLLRKVAALASSAPTSISKFALAASPSTPLPFEILARRKTGFSIPVYDWVDSSIPEFSNGKKRKSRRSNAIGPRTWARSVIDRLI
ncbi:MAG: asparagine synthase (glutamine-hydrolyzing) [Betaproteobacteria bacterium]